MTKKIIILGIGIAFCVLFFFFLQEDEKDTTVSNGVVTSSAMQPIAPSANEQEKGVVTAGQVKITKEAAPTPYITPESNWGDVVIRAAEGESTVLLRRHQEFVLERADGTQVRFGEGVGSVTWSKDRSVFATESRDTYKVSLYDAKGIRMAEIPFAATGPIFSDSGKNLVVAMVEHPEYEMGFQTPLRLTLYDVVTGTQTSIVRTSETEYASSVLVTDNGTVYYTLGRDDAASSFNVWTKEEGSQKISGDAKLSHYFGAPDLVSPDMGKWYWLDAVDHFLSALDVSVSTSATLTVEEGVIAIAWETPGTLLRITRKEKDGSEKVELRTIP